MSAAVRARKVAEVLGRVARIRELLPTDVATFRAERTAAEALILNLYLGLQAVSDLAMLLVAERALGVPGTPREALALLERAQVIDGGLSTRLSAAIGLRNRIAHQYGTLDLGLVYEAARDDLGDLEAFARAATAVITPT